MKRRAILAALSALCTALSTAAVAQVSELSITNSDFVKRYTPGGAVTYTIVVQNAGPDEATGAVVSDVVSTLGQFSASTWFCAPTGGAVCAVNTQAGDLHDTITLPAGATATYTLNLQTATGTGGPMTNTATITPPAGTTDDPSNDTAVDTDAAAGLIYVSNLGDDTTLPSCGLVDTPCLTIAKTISLAQVGDTIVVHAGTYPECVTLPAGRELRLESDEHLTTATNLVTFLDGAGICDGVGNAAGPVVTLTEGSSVAGFTIRNGGRSGIQGSGAVTITDNAITTCTTDASGGGIALTGGATLVDPASRVFVARNRVFTTTADGNGGGIAIDVNGHPPRVDVANNNLSATTAGDGIVGAEGGGIALSVNTATAADVASVTLSGNLVDGGTAKNAIGNASLAKGGGLYVSVAAVAGAGTETVTIGKTNVFRNNVSEGSGGGVLVELLPAPGGTHAVTVTGNSLTNNRASAGGAGAHVFARARDRSAPSTFTVSVAGNSIVGNQTQGTLVDPHRAGGGGLSATLESDRSPASAVSFAISGNTIENNVAAPVGGGASLLAFADDDPASDGATAPADAVIEFDHNLVAQNRADDQGFAGASGGGCAALATARGGSATARISQDFITVADNQTEVGPGGIAWDDAHPANSLGTTGTTSFALTNSVVFDNQAYGVGGTIVPGAGTEVTINYTDAFENFSADYQAPLSGAVSAGPGNLSIDPKLDALFLPTICSPVIDAGDPTISPALEPEPNGHRVNIGYLGNSISATRTFPDINGDGLVDGLDVLAIAVSFNHTAPGPPYFAAADRDFNGLIDGNDLAYVTAFFAQSCP